MSLGAIVEREPVRVLSRDRIKRPAAYLACAGIDHPEWLEPEIVAVSKFPGGRPYIECQVDHRLFEQDEIGVDEAELGPADDASRRHTQTRYIMHIAER